MPATVSNHRTDGGATDQATREAAEAQLATMQSDNPVRPPARPRAPRPPASRRPDGFGSRTRFSNQAAFFVALSAQLGDNSKDPISRQAAGIAMKNALDGQVRAPPAAPAPVFASGGGRTLTSSVLCNAQSQQVKMERMQRWATLDPTAKGQVKQTVRPAPPAPHVPRLTGARLVPSWCKPSRPRTSARGTPRRKSRRKWRRLTCRRASGTT